MKINSEYELADLLGRAFAEYANQVQRGAIQPYLDFMKGATRISVQIQLNENGTITIIYSRKSSSPLPIGVHETPPRSYIEIEPPAPEPKEERKITRRKAELE